MKLRNISQDQFLTWIEYLCYVSGVDLAAELERARSADDRNPAKVIDTLQLIQRCTGEAAKYLQDHGLPT